jgi:hypothetical protein
MGMNGFVAFGFWTGKRGNGSELNTTFDIMTSYFE